MDEGKAGPVSSAMDETAVAEDLPAETERQASHESLDSSLEEAQERERERRYGSRKPSLCKSACCACVPRANGASASASASAGLSQYPEIYTRRQQSAQPHSNGVATHAKLSGGNPARGDHAAACQGK
jgi:hypothetical protein